MLQFYLVSVVANVIGGIALSAGYLDEHFSAVSGIRNFFDTKPGVRVSVGVVAIIAGVLKLLSVTAGDVPVVGDLVPALSGLLVGTALIFERYKEKSTLPSETRTGVIDLIDRTVLKNKSLVGILALVVGILHFFIPGVLFL